MMEHYTKEELDQYRNGGMSVLRKINCAAHLKNCKKCAELLKELEADDQLLRDLRGSVELFRQFEAEPKTHRSSKQV